MAEKQSNLIITISEHCRRLLHTTFNQAKSNKKEENSYGIFLYTCVPVMGIHLEIVGDLSLEECLRAPQRLIARKGTAKVIVFENDSQFKLAKSTARYKNITTNVNC